MINQQTIKKRILKLYEDRHPMALYLLVKTETGEEKEVAVKEWANHWKEWDFLKVTRGSSLADLDIILEKGMEAAYDTDN